MKVFTPRWRKWTTVVLGAYLFIAPWIFGVSGDEASLANAWIVGACIVVVTLRVPIVSGPQAAELIKVGLGAWLLVSPFALGFAGSGATWSAWIVGALILALADTLSLTFDFLSWLHMHELRYQVGTITPERLIRCGGPDQHIGPEQLCWQIVECSYQIRRTLLGQTSGVEVGMCLLGYRACVNDSITLDRLIDKELPESGPVRRLRLEMIRRQAAQNPVTENGAFRVPRNSRCCCASGSSREVERSSGCSRGAGGGRTPTSKTAARMASNMAAEGRRS